VRFWVQHLSTTQFVDALTTFPYPDAQNNLRNIPGHADNRLHENLQSTLNSQMVRLGQGLLPLLETVKNPDHASSIP
jgi:hypothetical protein